MGSFLGLFRPLLIVSSTHTNNTLDVFKLDPYDPECYALNSYNRVIAPSIYLQEYQAPSEYSPSLVHPFTIASAPGQN